MDKKKIKALETFAQEQGLQFDEKGEVVFGTKNGFDLTISTLPGTYRFLISLSLAQAGEEPLKRALQQIVSAHKSLRSVEVNRYRVEFSVKVGMGLRKNVENLGNALNDLVEALEAAGFESCCQNCGKAAPTDPYMVGPSARQLCPECAQQVSEAAVAGQAAKKQKRENIVGGIVGALLGSLIGAACIVGLSQLGYVASLSGVVMGVCCVKGYELLGGKLSGKGLVISIVIMAAMVYVANQADWGITAAFYFSVDFMTAFRSIPDLIRAGAIEKSAYYGGLAMSYLFTALGAVPSVLASWKNKNQSLEVYKL